MRVSFADPSRFHYFSFASLFLVLTGIGFLSRPAVAITIDNPAVLPSALDSQGEPLLPYIVNYGLSTNGNATLVIKNQSGVIARHLVTNKLVVNDTISTQTVTWNGLADNGQPVPVGIYTFVFDATDAVTSVAAPEQTVSFPVITSAAAASAGDPKQIFEGNAFVFPNPVRGGAAQFNFKAGRSGATITLKIYTLNGTLVLSKTIASNAAANVNGLWPSSGYWNVTNDSGQKLGRGLYYCVFREADPQGTLEVTKKMVVLP